MLENIKNSITLKVLMTIMVGLVFLSFLFTVAFGTGNTAYQLINLLNLIINLLVLILVGAFFYGVYKIIKENAEPLQKEIIALFPQPKECPKCYKKLETSWKICPYCGEKVLNEGA